MKGTDMPSENNHYLNELAHAQNDTLNTFKQRMLAGDIVDYRPYLEKPSQYADHLIEMASEGICVNELAKLDHDTIRCVLIANEHATEHYPEWARTGTRTVQYTLADTSYCPDLLIQSPHAEVRLRVAKKHPQYMTMLMNKVENEKEAWYSIYDVFMTQEHPEPSLLKRFFKYDRPNGANLDILKSKYKTALMEPSVIEKTMTDYQLFSAGKVLWKQNITGYGIWCIKHAKKVLDNRYELTEEDFNYLKRQDNQWRVDEYLTKYDEPIEVVSNI